ncbi:MAG: hypothetical protein GXO66_06160 [Euryarchaeota archaeon]|nr:hypothetical protein [Euryarchaeota archaeon]
MRLGAAVLLLLLVVGCTAGDGGADRKPGEEELTRKSSQGEVDVDVVYLNPLMPEERERIVFKVYLNTHTVDLSGYRVEKLATFRNSRGMEVKEGFAWIPEMESGHHRYGYLVLPARVNGTELVTPEDEYIELVIDGIQGRRVFRWDLRELR